MTIENHDMAGDLLQGIRQISENFGWQPWQTQYRLNRGHIPGAFKIGGIWHLRRSTAREWINSLEHNAPRREGLPDLGDWPTVGHDFCGNCARPMPASLIDAALFICGDPEMRDDLFALNVRQMLLRGLPLAPAHRDRLLALYSDRHRAYAEICHFRRRDAERAGAASLEHR